ncbi:hypothetical protein Tco_1306414, partial [Tanacetum coccineum]
KQHNDTVEVAAEYVRSDSPSDWCRLFAGYKGQFQHPFLSYHANVNATANLTFVHTSKWKNQLSLPSLRVVSHDTMDSGTSATHYYLNPNIPETYQIREMYTQATDATPILDVQSQRHQTRENKKSVIHHQTHLIGQSHVKNDTLDDEKAQERWDFTLLTLSKEAQAVSITDCQAGNPCEI